MVSYPQVGAEAIAAWNSDSSFIPPGGGETLASGNVRE